MTLFELLFKPVEAGTSFWSSFFEWTNNVFGTFIQASPEIFTIVAMVFILIGMVGSKKFMNYAVTSILLAFVGVIICAVL